MSAQDTVPTVPPSFYSDFFTQSYQDSYEPDYRAVYVQYGTKVYILSNDAEEVTIYFRIIDEGEPSGWFEYESFFPIVIYQPGHFEFEAYAHAEGKLPSEIVSYSLDVEWAGTELLYRACIVDGINYRFIDGTTDVEVCSDGDPMFPSESYYTGDVVIPDEIDFGGELYTVTGISSYAFYSCGELTGVQLPNTIQNIGQNAFYGCTSLTSIDFPESVTTIQDLVFEGCTSLTRVTCRSISPPWVSSAYGLFWPDDLYYQATLFVPAESLEAYKTYEEWERFGHIVPFVGAGPGDVDGDGNIGINDVTTLIDQLLSDGEQSEWMDVNGDGTVGIADITLIIDMMLSGNN